MPSTSRPSTPRSRSVTGGPASGPAHVSRLGALDAERGQACSTIPRKSSTKRVGRTAAASTWRIQSASPSSGDGSRSRLRGCQRCCTSNRSRAVELLDEPRRRCAAGGVVGPDDEHPLAATGRSAVADRGPRLRSEVEHDQVVVGVDPPVSGLQVRGQLAVVVQPPELGARHHEVARPALTQGLEVLDRRGAVRRMEAGPPAVGRLREVPGAASFAGEQRVVPAGHHQHARRPEP